MSEYTGPRPGDATGLKKQQLEKEHALEMADVQERMSTTTRVEDQRKQREIIDYSGADEPLPELQLDEAEELTPFVVFRASQAIEKMVFGREIRIEKVTDEQGTEHEIPVPAGLNFFDFEEGRQCKVPRPLFEHLLERGYVAQF